MVLRGISLGVGERSGEGASKQPRDLGEDVDHVVLQDARCKEEWIYRRGQGCIDITAYYHYSSLGKRAN